MTEEEKAVPDWLFWVMIFGAGWFGLVSLIKINWDIIEPILPW